MKELENDLARRLRSAYLSDARYRATTDRLMSSLLHEEGEDEWTCEACQDHLPEYLLAKRGGTADAPEWRTIALHLSLCPHCTEEFAALSELARKGFDEPVTEPLACPEPHLSFLRKPVGALRPAPVKQWRLDDFGRLLIDLAAALWQPSPRLAPTYAIRDEEAEVTEVIAGRQLPARFSLDSTELNDLQVDITVLPERDAPGLCSVVIRVEVPSHWPDITEAEVTLVAGEIARTALTNESGEATFHQVAVSALDAATLTVKSAP